MAQKSYRATFRRHSYTDRRGRTHRTRSVPGLHLENGLHANGASLVAGVDEVGVGAWAGPLVVAAVVLEPGRRIYKVRDSKLLDPDRRSWLSERVKERALGWSIGMAWPDEIDELGLSEATRRAGARALSGLPIHPDAVLLDGKWNFIGAGTKTVVRGDCESLSIASASLVAKVARDLLMGELSGLFPQYGFVSNKGYPSPDHKWALAAFGPSGIHRRLFAPVRQLFETGVPGRLLPARSTMIAGAGIGGIDERRRPREI